MGDRKRQSDRVGDRRRRRWDWRGKRTKPVEVGVKLIGPLFVEYLRVQIVCSHFTLVVTSVHTESVTNHPVEVTLGPSLVLILLVVVVVVKVVLKPSILTKS